MTSLFYAVKNNMFDIIDLLLDADADYSLVDAEGDNPFKYLLRRQKAIKNKIG